MITGLIFLDASTVVKYLFLCHIKNPTAIKDDFWILFLNIWSIALALISQGINYFNFKTCRTFRATVQRGNNRPKSSVFGSAKLTLPNLTKSDPLHPALGAIMDPPQQKIQHFHFFLKFAAFALAPRGEIFCHKCEFGASSVISLL